jgi:multidrug efflux pump
MATLLLLLIAGSYAYIAIPKESDPDVNIPNIYVSMRHEGISPEDAERLLVRPMEKELRTIEGVKEMRASAYEGGANILLEFDAGFDADQALTDVREQVDLAKIELPADTDEPEVQEVNLGLLPVLVVTLSGEAPERLLLRLARLLQDEIEGIPSVLEVTISGDREEQVEIVIDPMLVDSYGLNPAEIFNLVSRSNQLIAAGALDTGSGRFAIKVPGLFESLPDILNMPLISDGDAVVRIRDVARVYRHFKDPTTYARVNGQRALALEVSKRTGENIIETIGMVRALVSEAEKSFPPGVVVSFSQDRSNDIRMMLSDLQNNITSAILLVMIVIVAALGLRGGLLVGVAIPGSFLTGILVLYAAGFTVNIVVLFALILATGMLVDGAIVVTEYADRKMAEGEPKEVAYGMAAKRMAWPIIASTATTLAAFMPLLFWPGVVGEFMKYLPMTLLVTLSASLAMALIFIPVLGTALRTVVGLVVAVALAGGLFQLGLVLAGTPLVGAALALPGLVLGWKLGLWFGTLLERSDADPSVARALSGNQPKSATTDEDADNSVDLTTVKGPTGIYIRALERVIRRPGVVLAIAGVVLISVYAAYGRLGHGVEFFPDVEPEQLVVNIHARGNLAAAEMDQLVSEVEAEVLAMQAEQPEFSTVYVSSGLLPSRDGDAEDIIGKIQIELADWDTRRRASVIMEDIRTRTADLGGIWVEVRKPDAGPPVGKPVQLQLSSLDPAKLETATEIVRARFNDMPGLIDVEDTRPVPGIEWRLEVDRAQAAKFGADVQLIGSFVQMVTKGLKISDYRPNDSDDEIDILARYPLENRTIDQLDRIRLTTSEGLVPLGNFVTRSAEQKTGTLNRVDGHRVMTVRADVAEGLLADAKVRELREWLTTNPLPAGVGFDFRGEDEEQAAAQDFLMKAFGVALFIMAVILVTQFNSFYSAFLILSAVVMSTVGVLIGLMVIGQPFGF